VLNIIMKVVAICIFKSLWR